MERWVGRVAVVTGASAGIGAALVEDLVKKGLKVVGIARRVEKVQDIAGTLRAKSEKGTLYPLKCDISNEAEVKEAFQWIKKNLGQVDILINNAGVGRRSNLTEGPYNEWKQILDLNILGLSNCTVEALKLMKEKGVDDGHIIHINSVVGHYIPNSPLINHMYAASKHAVTVLTEGLRRELVRENSKIRVTSVSPGIVETEFVAASGRPVDPETFYKSYPHLKAKDVSDVVLFAIAAPPHVQLHEMTVMPVGQAF